MSAYEIISLLVWTISAVAVIISLYWVNRQTRLFAQQTEYVARSVSDSLAQSLSSQSHEISRIFVEYPELRPYFYYGQPIDENNPDFHRAEAVCELILDIFWSMSTQVSQVDTSLIARGDPGNLWQGYLDDAFAQSPILVKTLVKRKNWYGQAMVDQMNTSLKRRSIPIPA